VAFVVPCSSLGTRSPVSSIVVRPSIRWFRAVIDSFPAAIACWISAAVNVPCGSSGCSWPAGQVR
jgi:hypothetical protein